MTLVTMGKGIILYFMGEDSGKPLLYRPDKVIDEVLSSWQDGPLSSEGTLREKNSKSFRVLMVFMIQLD